MSTNKTPAAQHTAEHQDDNTSQEATVAALSALYQADRQDSTSILIYGITLMSVGFAYIALLAANMDDVIEFIPCLSIGWLAIPVWMLIAFHALAVALVIAHGQTAAIVKRKLATAAHLSARDTAIIMGPNVSDPDVLVHNTRAGTGIKALLGSWCIAHGGFLLTALAFTWLVIDKASALPLFEISDFILGFGLPIIIYGFCLLTEIFAILYIFGDLRADLESGKLRRPPAKKG